MGALGIVLLYSAVYWLCVSAVLMTKQVQLAGAQLI